MILYLYGHGRLSSRVRDRRMISTKSGDTWAYFAHCASLCFILALAVVKAPLMHDFSAIYKGSLDGAVLIAGKFECILYFPCLSLYMTMDFFPCFNLCDLRNIFSFAPPPHFPR